MFCAQQRHFQRRIPVQDGLLSRASKKLASDEGIFPELGPARLDRELQKYIWNGKDHLSLKDVWEYLNRYTYLPRIKGREVLIKTVQSAISGLVPGPFAYAERWDTKDSRYIGLVIENAATAPVVIDSDSVIVTPEVAVEHRPRPDPIPGSGDADGGGDDTAPEPTGGGHPSINPKPVEPTPEILPTRFIGTVMISPDRPAHEMRQIVEAIVEQLTVLPESEVSLRLEIDAEVGSGLDRSKVRTLMENANTLGFIDKLVK